MSMDGTALWQSLLSTALVGTGRQAPSLPGAEGALGTLLTGWNPSEPEGKLLGAAGVVALYRRAGRTPAVASDATAWEPCDTGDMPVIGPRAEYYLGVVLNGDHKDLFPEWLEAVAKTGKRVPERYLPEVLDAGRRQTSLRDAIKPVLGRRGRWLAQRNPDWKYVSDLENDLFAIGDAEMADSVWETGTRATRVELLEQARRSDPERARAWVAGSWAQENADSRQAFLNTFATNLSMDDEPFLEQALDDRGKDVRAVAANLLPRLPESRFSQRMMARADAAVTIKRGLLGKITLEANPPEETDKAMLRDGIAEKSPLTGTGDRAWRLREIVSATPLSYWSEKSGSTPPLKLLEAAEGTEWASDLMIGWVNACRRERDPAWAEALWRYYQAIRERHQLKPGDQASGSRQGLIDAGLMLPTMRESLILDSLKRESDALRDTHPALELLQAQTAPWSEALALAVIASIQRRRAQTMSQPNADWRTLQLLKESARLVPPYLADALTTGWPPEPEEVPLPADAPQADINRARQIDWAQKYWRDAIREFIGTLQFRRDLLKEVGAE